MSYYGMDGRPISFAEFCALFKSEDGRRVAQDERDGILVSTVLLGLDHAWGNGPPLIFETMIFGGKHDQWQARYATREQAEQGHLRACALAFGDAPAEQAS